MSVDVASIGSLSKSCAGVVPRDAAREFIAEDKNR